MDNAVLSRDLLSAAQRVMEWLSLEITPRETKSLQAACLKLPPATLIAVPFLPGDTLQDRVTACVAIRNFGFEPMPHFSARRFNSLEELDTSVDRLVDEASVKHCLIVAGDPAEPAGPFPDSAALIASGKFERAGITHVGIGGHPEGHPHMTADERWTALRKKCREIRQRGMSPVIVTQFGFDPEVILTWLKELRNRGIEEPIRIGIPGPASVGALLGFAARCGVGATSAVMTKYGVSLVKLVGTATPDRFVLTLASRLGPEQGAVRLHFYPFGGLLRTVDWIQGFAATR